MTWLIVGLVLGFILVQATRAVWKLDELLRIIRSESSQPKERA